MRYDEEEASLVEAGPDLLRECTHGEWIGLIKTTAAGSAAIKQALSELSQRADFRTRRFDDLLNHLIATGERVQVLYITGHWLDVDDLEDLARAQAF